MSDKGNQSPFQETTTNILGSTKQSLKASKKKLLFHKNPRYSIQKSAEDLVVTEDKKEIISNSHLNKSLKYEDLINQR